MPEAKAHVMHTAGQMAADEDVKLRTGWIHMDFKVRLRERVPAHIPAPFEQHTASGNQRVLNFGHVLNLVLVSKLLASSSWPTVATASCE